MKTRLPLLVTLLGMLVAGCEKVGTGEAEEAEPVEMADSQEVAGVNTNDPQEVAEAVWQAINENDYERVRKFVIPSKRDDLSWEAIEKELREFPPLPESPEVDVVAIFNGRGHTLILNMADQEKPSPTIEMLYGNGRWWIGGP